MIPLSVKINVALKVYVSDKFAAKEIINQSHHNNEILSKYIPML